MTSLPATATTLAAATLLASLTLACEPPNIDDYNPANQPAATSNTPQEDEILLAEVDGEPITLGDFQRRLSKLGEVARNRVGSATARRDLLESMIAAQLLASAAQREGLAEDPEVTWAARRAERDVVLERVAREDASNRPLGRPELDAYYDINAYRFDRPESLWLAVLLADDPARARSLLTDYQNRYATDVETSLQRFDEMLAAEAERVPQPGDLGFVSRRELTAIASDALVDAAFGLRNAGDVSEPVPVAGGWALVQLRQRRGPLHQPLAEVEETLRDEVAAARERLRRSQLEHAWRRAASVDVDVDETLLQQLVAAHAAQGPPPTPAEWESWSDLTLDDRLTPTRDLTMFAAPLGPAPEVPTPPEGTGTAPRQGGQLE